MYHFSKKVKPTKAEIDKFIHKMEDIHPIWTMMHENIGCYLTENNLAFVEKEVDVYQNWIETISDMRATLPNNNAIEELVEYISRLVYLHMAEHNKLKL